MILKVTDASQSPQWTVRLLFDYGARSWRLLERPAPAVWARIAAGTRGPFELVDGGKVAWLWDQPNAGAKRNPLILWDPPRTPQDAGGKSGGGRLYDPKDPGLKGGQVRWSAAGSADAGEAGDSIRDDAMALIARNLPSTPMTYIDPPNWVEKQDHGENTKKNAFGFRATGCGGLPGKLFAELAAMGWPIPTDQVDATNPKYTGRKREPDEKAKWMKLAGSSTGYKFIVQDGIEKRLGTPGKIYVRYKKGDDRRPQPGDVYVLDIKDTAMFRHVGVVVDASTDTWITADGGQNGPKNSGFAIGLTKRSFDPKKGLVGGIGEKGDLDGWIDLEALVGE